MLAGIIITIKDSRTPLAIFPRVSFFIGEINLCSNIATILTAIFGFASATLWKLFHAIFACQNWRRLVYHSAFIRASNTPFCCGLFEFNTTYNACECSAFITEVLARMRYCEWLRTLLTMPDECIDFRDIIDRFPINTTPACLIVRLDRLTAFWAWLGFIWHNIIIVVNMRYVKCISDMGLTPERKQTS